MSNAKKQILLAVEDEITRDVFLQFFDTHFPNAVSTFDSVADACRAVTEKDDNNNDHDSGNDTPAVLLTDMCTPKSKTVLEKAKHDTPWLLPLCLGGNTGENMSDNSGERNIVCLPLPIHLGNVLTRSMRHLMRKTTLNVTVGPWLLVPNEGRLSAQEDSVTDIRLTEKECDILALLHSRNGVAVDRQELLDDVWGYAADVETHTLETHIYRLRQKIETDPAKPRYLLTDGSGYRLAP